jgi:hypothetical protein
MKAIVYDWRGLTRFAMGIYVVRIMEWLRRQLPKRALCSCGGSWCLN